MAKTTNRPETGLDDDLGGLAAVSGGPDAAQDATPAPAATPEPSAPADAPAGPVAAPEPPAPPAGSQPAAKKVESTAPPAANPTASTPAEEHPAAGTVLRDWAPTDAKYDPKAQTITPQERQLVALGDGANDWKYRDAGEPRAV